MINGCIEQFGFGVPECLREPLSEPLEAAVAADDGEQVGRRVRQTGRGLRRAAGDASPFDTELVPRAWLAVGRWRWSGRLP